MSYDPNSGIATRTGPAVSGGGIFAVTLSPGVDLPADGVYRVRAYALLSHSTAPHVDTTAALSAECVLSIENSVIAFVAATAGSTNPMNSNTAAYAAAHPQAADAGFTAAGPPTAVWTVGPGGIALIMSVTNPGATSATAQVSFTVEMLFA